MKKIKILIADDHPLMREALKAALLDEPDMDVVGEAQDGLETLALAAEIHPDVILMDLLMPGMSGLETLVQLQKDQPQVKVLVVTSMEDEKMVLAAVQGGALGYFPKSAPRTYLLEAVRKVVDGVPYLPSGIARKLFDGLKKVKIIPEGRSAVDEPLTTRQQELLNLIGEGRTDLEIAEALHVTEATVRSHVHHIMQRLGLSTRSQLVVYVNKQDKKRL